MSDRDCKRFLWILFLLGLAVTFLVAMATATTLSRFKFEDLAAQATAIARVHCLHVQSHWNKGEIWTRTQFLVVETHKGSLPRVLEIDQPGGVVGHLHSRVEQVPAFVPGEEDFLFLWQPASGDFRILGWSQGAFRVHKDLETQLETVTQDSASLPLFDPVSRQFRHGGIRNFPLAAFQVKLRRALEK